MSFAGQSVARIRDSLNTLAVNQLLPEYEQLRNFGTAVDPDQHGASGIIGVYSEGQPRLFRFNVLAQVTEHHPRGFTSIGSGGPLAEHAITVFREIRSAKGFSLFHAKILAFRVIQDAIAIGGPGAAIGGAVQMAVLEPGSNGIVLERDDEMLRDQVLIWSKLEAESFIAQASPPTMEV